VPLERLEKDPEEAEAGATDEAEPDGPPGEMRRGRGPRTAPPTEPKIDWSGLKRRTRQVTRGATRVSGFIPARNGTALFFVGSEGRGPGGGQAIYRIQDDGKRLTRLTAGTA